MVNVHGKPPVLGRAVFCILRSSKKLKPKLWQQLPNVVVTPAITTDCIRATK
jgi:hypothetical protein